MVLVVALGNFDKFVILLFIFTSVRSFVQISGVVLCISYFVYYFLYYYFVIILCHVFCLSFCWFIRLCSLFSIGFIFKSLHFLLCIYLYKQLFQLAHFQIFWQPEWIKYLEYLFVALFPLFVMKNESELPENFLQIIGIHYNLFIWNKSIATHVQKCTPFV